MAGIRYHGKLGVQQRVLPPYRAAFFDELALACESGLSVFAGYPRPAEAIISGTLYTAAYVNTINLHLLSGPLYLCWQEGLLNWLEQWNPDALIVEANPRYLSTPAALRWMKHQGRPVLGWGLGAPPLTGALAPLRRNHRLSFILQFDALITYSRRGANEYAALGYPASKIFIAPNAAVPRPAWLMPTRPAVLDGKPIVLFVGRLQARKRVDLLLQACAALPENLQPKLIIIGDGPERAALENLAGRIYPTAVFPGARHAAELVPYYSSADLFVLPGSGGLAVQEAMAYGLPIIMGQGDGTNNDLVSPRNGWQMPDPGALVGLLREALSDVPRLRVMGAESYRIVSEEINLEKMVAVFVNALNGLTA